MRRESPWLRKLSIFHHSPIVERPRPTLVHTPSRRIKRVDGSIDCPHLLLFVDVDNHDAQGGLLFEAFNEVWRSFCSQHDDDLERNPPFRDLLEEVDCIASAAPPEFETDQGPGTCFGYRAFYLDSPRERKAAIKKFRAASVEWELRWPPRAGDE